MNGSWFSLVCIASAPTRAATVRTCEKIVSISGLTDESVCPTLMRRSLRLGGAGASACQPFLSRFLSLSLGERYRGTRGGQ
jgi:hypothetical protein